MYSTRQLIVSSVLLIAVSQAALAVQTRDMNPPNHAAVSSTGVVERGGTVTAFDPAKKLIVVDKVPFALNDMPVKIHPAGGGNEKNFVLKADMQIRFHTSKENFSAQDKVLEIWVTGVKAKPAGKK